MWPEVVGDTHASHATVKFGRHDLRHGIRRLKSVIGQVDQGVLAGYDRLWKIGRGAVISSGYQGNAVGIVPAVLNGNGCGIGVAAKRRMQECIHGFVRVSGIVVFIPIGGATQVVGAGQRAVQGVIDLDVRVGVLQRQFEWPLVEAAFMGKRGGRKGVGGGCCEAL